MRVMLTAAVVAMLVPTIVLAQTTTCMVSGHLVQCNSPTQQTNCMGGQGLVTCQTTNTGILNYPRYAPPPPPPDNSARENLQASEANFGAAAGGLVARLIERARERKMENRQFAEQALQRGDCATAHTMALKDKEMLTYVDGTCANMAAQAAQRAGEAKAATDVQAFAADPGHPRFMEVRLQMSDLLRNGTAHTLQEAYDMATAAPATGTQRAPASPAPAGAAQ